MKTVNIELVHAFMSRAHTCAMVLLGNASYIEKELDAVRISDERRAETGLVCQTLIGTKHDIVTEVSEMHDLLGEAAAPTVILERAERIVRWFQEDMGKLNALVMGLATDMEADPGSAGAYVLVAESASNILSAFKETVEALACLQAGAGGAS